MVWKHPPISYLQLFIGVPAIPSLEKDVCLQIYSDYIQFPVSIFTAHAMPGNDLVLSPSVSFYSSTVV